MNKNTNRHEYGIGIECEFTPLIDITEYKDELGYSNLPFLFMTPFDLMFSFGKFKPMTEEELNQSIKDNDEKLSKLAEKEKYIDYIKKNYNSLVKKNNYLMLKIDEFEQSNPTPIILRNLYKTLQSVTMTDFYDGFRAIMGRDFKFTIRYSDAIKSIIGLEIKYVNDFISELELFNNIKGFEVKNSDSNKKLRYQIQEILDEAKYYTDKFKQLVPFYKEKYIIHNGYMANIYSPKMDTVVNSYTGSYHINLTFPVEINKNILNFEKKHVNFMRAIRTIEPLLLACCTSVGYNIFGDKHKYPESSARLLFSGYFNFMTAYPLDVSLYENEKPTMMRGDNRKYKASPFIQKLELKLKNIFPDIDKIEGSDFRINSTYHVPEKDAYFGFEFRFFDFINLQDFKTMVQFIIMLCDYVEINNILVDNISFEEDHYVDMVVEIFKEGWNVIVPDVYIELLNNIFKFNLDKNNNYYDTLNKIYNIVVNLTTNNEQAVFRNTMISSDIYKKNIPNPNKRFYEKMLELQIPDIKKRLQNIRSRVTDNNFENFKIEAIKEFAEYDNIEEDLVDIYNFIQE